MSLSLATLLRTSAALLLLVAVAAHGVAAAENDAAPTAENTAAKVDFAGQVQPILQKHCVSCHGAELEEGGLRLDIGRRALEGGDGGAVIAPKNSAGSRLIAAVAGRDEELGRMPPEGEGAPLADEQIALLKTWIDQGAHWPQQADASLRGADHWSFQPIADPAPPAVAQRNWPRNAIDSFILARLEGEGVSPSPEASREILIRRLYFDLVGLPPSPAAVDAFLADNRPNAYEQLVDRLLASPHFGERWGRRWLDLARYADTDGYEKDRPRPNAWRYRDWVIDALNADMAYDRFSIAQLAGDMLPGAPAEVVMATGFHRNTLHNTEGGVDREEDRVKKTVDRTNTVGAIWMGLTVGCAQCHSHKYDPLTQREYFSLYALLNSMDERDVNIPGGKARAVAERGSPRTTFVHLRGDFLSEGAKTEPNTPAILPGLSPRGQQPDRLDLATWLFSRDHPLTARVAVNRTWMRMFGRGLVENVDDFGMRCAPPTHPQLLDWLASRFRRDWSAKRLLRTIVTSATYRQSSQQRPDLVARDPENTLFARQTRRRLEAELVRDVALAASGLLDRRLGGPSVRPPQPAEYARLTYANSAKWETSKGGDRYRRGLYTFYQRTSPYPMLAAFDAPDSNAACTRRIHSNTPLQALTIWNSAAFVECGKALGRRVVREIPPAGESATRDRALRAWRLCFGRAPDDAELAEVIALYEDQLAACRADPSSAAAITGGKADDPNTPQLAAWMLVGRALVNLDEMITRP